MNVTRLKNVILVNQTMKGHARVYLKLYSEYLLKHGYRVHVLTTAAEQAAEDVKIHSDRISYGELPSLTDSIIRLPILNKMNYLLHYGDTVKNWKLLHKLVLDSPINPDLVFFMWMEHYLNPLISKRQIERIFPLPFSGIYLHASIIRKTPLKLLNGKLLRSRFCAGICTLDSGIVEALSLRFNKRCMALPDVVQTDLPLESTPLLDAIRSKIQDRPIISCMGGLDRRKNFLPLLRYAHAHPEIGVVCCGKLKTKEFSNEELKEIQNMGLLDNVFLFTQIIDTEEEMNAIIASSSIVYLVYSNFYGSSNILVKASWFRKKSIVSDKGLMADLVQKYRIGQSTQSDQKAINNCINSLLCPASLSDPNFDSFNAIQSIDNLESVFKRLLT